MLPMLDRNSVNKKIMAIGHVLPELTKALASCDLCRRSCEVDRTKGENGFCRAGAEAVVYSFNAHHGEEPPISGTGGSGTIFFSHCSMGCVYCQNYQFSQTGAGKQVSALGLVEIMLELQKSGCHNINLVSPTHFVPPILAGLREAFSRGLKLPIVYNTGGYDSPHVIRALDGIVDVYLPDMRYSSDEMAEKFSMAPGYVANNRKIVKEMLRQAGELQLDGEIAVKGLIIRLLIMPNNVSGTLDTLDFIASELGTNVHLSVMSQYYPAYNARSDKSIMRRIYEREYDAVRVKMEKLGIHVGWIQPFEGDFDKRFAGETFLPNI